MLGTRGLALARVQVQALAFASPLRAAPAARATGPLPRGPASSSLPLRELRQRVLLLLHAGRASPGAAVREIRGEARRGSSSPAHEQGQCTDAKMVPASEEWALPQVGRPA